MECLQVQQLPDSADWLYEVKLDGYRAIAVKDGNDVALYSRYGNALSADFPGIVFALKQLKARAAVLDGEIVALDADGRPNFQQLQNRKRTKLPLVFYVFDVLHLEREDLLQQPLRERRERLSRVATTFEEPVRVAPVLEVKLEQLLRQVHAAKLEGVVAKRARSAYEAGKRSGAWQKKRLNEQAEFVIGGYFPAPSAFDALLIGEWREEGLFFLKKLRAGFTPALRRDVLRDLAPLKTRSCPFVNLPERQRSGGHPLDEAAMKECVWVQPQIKCEVDYVERTGGGKLRHAKFRRLISSGNCKR